MKNAAILSSKAKDNHDALSNAIWAWVMNLSAAANAKDQETYDLSKKNIESLTGKASVTKSLETGLLRTAVSNDYPAWALGKLLYAAKIRNDVELYHDSDAALRSSIAKSNAAGAKAEYTLAVLENQLALKRNWPDKKRESQLRPRAKL